MRNLRDISGYLLKLLLIITTVLFLSACAKDGDTDSVIGENIATSCDENDTECRQALCLGCSLLELMYNAASKHVMSMHASLTGGAMAVMMVGFSIWLALRLLKFVSSVTETNAGEVWNEIVRKAFICLICGLLASSSGGLLFVMNMLVFPVYRAFMELGIAILNNSLSSETPTTFTVFGSTLQVSDINLRCSIEGDFMASKENGFPASLITAMVCMMRMVSGYLTIGSEIALESMRQTSAVMGTVMGIVLYAFFWVVKVGFSFYLVDMIFQMSIILLLLPLYVMSYAFGPTQSWAKKAFSNVLASSAFMMCFSIIVATVLVAMVSMLQKYPAIFDPDPDALEASMQDLSIGFMCLLLIGFLVYGSMGVSQQLTSALLGAKVSANFQKNLKAAVQAIGGAILSGVGMLFTWGMSLAPQSSIRLIRAIGNVNEKTKAYRAKIRRLAGRK